MMYEILDENNNVINCIVADASFMDVAYPLGNYREKEVSVVQQSPRHLAVGSFFDRFGVHKYAILADTRPEVQALIKDASVRRYIDLDRPDLPIGLQMLVDAGHNIDVQAIISDPILPEERPSWG